MLCVEMIALTVIPMIAQSSPDYVGGVIAVATNSSTTADLGLFVPLNLLVGVGYLLGGLLFGIALFRAGVLARWASALLAVAAVATAAIPLLPMVNQRLFAVPNGIAMIGLGWSLWREQRSPVADPARPQRRRTARPGRRPVTTHQSVRPTRSARPTGWVPFALVALVVVPAVAGALRLVELAGGPLLLPANPRMAASPLPVVVHVVCAVPYAVLGAFQFSAGLRRRHPRWHRATGRLVVAARPRGRALGAVDDPVLRPPARHRRARLPLPARLRVGHGRLHRARLRRDPPRRRRRPTGPG